MSEGPTPAGDIRVNVPPSTYGLWTGQSISVFGSMLTSLSLVLWLQQKGASPSVVSSYFVAASLTGLIAGLLSGPIADRYSKRIVVITGDVLAGCSVTCLALLYYLDVLNFWPLICSIIFLRCIIIVASNIRGPALSTYVAAVVPKDGFRRFNSAFTATRQVSGAIGEASGASMFALLGAGMMFTIDLASYLIAIVLSFFCMKPGVGVRLKAEGPKRSKAAVLLADSKEGFSYIKGHRELTLLVILALTMNIFYAPVIAWIPFRISSAVPDQEGWLGYANSALTVGMIAGSLLGGYLSRVRGKELLAIKMASLIVGGVLVGYGLMEGRFLSLFFSAALGLSVGFFNVVETSYIVELAKPEMRGRVMAFVSTMGQVVSPVSIAVGGWIASRSAPGLGPLFVASGAFMIVAAIIFIFHRSSGVPNEVQDAAG